jgi:single-strand DNA-binding protein
MSDNVTLSGLVATSPRHLITSEGLEITSFRLASTQRRYDAGKNEWVDGETNWYTVTCFRDLAVNAQASLVKGQRVIVVGRLRIRNWQTEDKTGTNVEVEADTIGHDLRFGSAAFMRRVRNPEQPIEEPAVK